MARNGQQLVWMVATCDDLRVVMNITQEVDPCGVDDWMEWFLQRANFNPHKDDSYVLSFGSLN